MRKSPKSVVFESFSDFGSDTTAKRSEKRKYATEEARELSLRRESDQSGVGVGIFTVCETERFGGKQTKEFHFPPLEKTPPSAHRTPVVTPATP